MAGEDREVSHMSEDKANDELVSESGDSSEGSSGSEEEEEEVILDQAPA
jgi:hypothetical protein